MSLHRVCHKEKKKFSYYCLWHTRCTRYEKKFRDERRMAVVVIVRRKKNVKRSCVSVVTQCIFKSRIFSGVGMSREICRVHVRISFIISISGDWESEFMC